MTVTNSSSTGSLTLTTTNTYTGGTTVSLGSLVLASHRLHLQHHQYQHWCRRHFGCLQPRFVRLGDEWFDHRQWHGHALAIIASQAVNFGSRPVTLNYDCSHPAHTISSGVVTLNGNAFTVNGSVLPVGGPYVLVRQASGNITTSGAYTVTGTALGVNTGTVTVSANQMLLNIAVTTPPTMTFSITGNNTSLNISWPGTYLGASLMYQSNSLATGINTNIAAWTVVPGSTTVTNEVIPIGKTNEVFFQLNFP